MKTIKKLFLAIAIIMMGLTATTLTSCSKDEIQTGLAGTQWKGRINKTIMISYNTPIDFCFMYLKFDYTRLKRLPQKVRVVQSAFCKNDKNDK